MARKPKLETYIKAYEIRDFLQNMNYKKQYKKAIQYSTVVQHIRYMHG